MKEKEATIMLLDLPGSRADMTMPRHMHRYAELSNAPYSNANETLRRIRVYLTDNGHFIISLESHIFHALAKIE